MDFSAFIDMVDENHGKGSCVRILTPKIYPKTPLRPIHKKGSVSVDYNSKPRQIFESRFEGKKGNRLQVKNFEDYKQEMLIDEALHYFKKHKFFSENKKSIGVKFLGTRKIFRVKRADYKDTLLETNSKRCQTAAYVKEMNESNKGSPRRFKILKTVKKEFSSQTKASSPSNKNLEIVSLRIKGTIKDFAIRKYSKISKPITIRETANNIY